MYAVWLGSDLLRGYHDPQEKTLDVLSSRGASEGQAVDLAGEVAISFDDEGVFCHLGVDLSGGNGEENLPRRPSDCRVAEVAELEVDEDAAVRWGFDPPTGELRVAFDGIDPVSWGRIGENLFWIALDEESRLAAISVEGVSRDPEGKAQATWLEEIGPA